MKPESNRIEYKQKLTDKLDIEKEVIAFLNYHEGGVIYIGIDKHGNAVGVEDLDGDMLKIKDRIKQNISPSAMGLFDVVEEEIDHKSIIKIIVASGSEKPYFKRKYGMSEKGCFIRIGTASEPMNEELINRLFSRRTRNSIGKMRSSRQDLTFEQLHIYYLAKGKKLNKQFKRNLELLTPDDELNYAGYLLADENNISVKVAKYRGTTKVDLIESNEYGYTSLVKATKSVLDKVDIENRTHVQITGKERIETPLWNKVAIREAIINAFVHTDYTLEVAPTVEIFSDRVQITSAGSLPDGVTEEEFFEGISVPRNKELMRIYKDLDLVEQLGSGVPRILQAYGKESFNFTKNFLRMTFDFEVVVGVDLDVDEQVTPHEGLITPQDNLQKSPQVTPQVERLLAVMKGEMGRAEIQEKLGLLDRKHFREEYLAPAIKMGLVEMTIPDKPNSRNQKYRLS